MELVHVFSLFLVGLRSETCGDCFKVGRAAGMRARASCARPGATMLLPNTRKYSSDHGTSSSPRRLIACLLLTSARFTVRLDRVYTWESGIFNHHRGQSRPRSRMGGNMPSTGHELGAQLPPELIQIIFDNLSYADFVTCSLVCSTWRQLALPGLFYSISYSFRSGPLDNNYDIQR